MHTHSAIPPNSIADLLGEQLQYLSPEEFPEHEPEQTIVRHFIDDEQSGSREGLPGDLRGLEQRMVDSIRSYVQENGEDEQLAEILPALIPIITAVAPAVIQGVSSLISNASKNRAPQRQAPPRTHHRPSPPPQQRSRPAPVRRPSGPSPRPLAGTLGSLASTAARAAGTIASTLASAPATTAAPTAGGAAPPAAAPIAQQLNLLSNPAVLGLLQQAAGSLSPGAETMLLGRDQIEVSLGSVLNALSQSAQMAEEQLQEENRSEIPEYLLDAEGNFLCDVSSPRERAEVLLQLLQEEQAQAEK